MVNLAYPNTNPNAIIVSPNFTVTGTQLINGGTSNAVVQNTMPSNITPGTNVDFMQTLPGHQIEAISIPVGPTAVSGNSITFPMTSVPLPFTIGDYVSTENECIIPMIPDDLHSGLAERACARILSALGDQAGMQMNATKLADIDKVQGTLLDNRSDGNPQKILARHTLLKFSKFGTSRRL
jgi:hypothetical protein